MEGHGFGRLWRLDDCPRLNGRQAATRSLFMPRLVHFSLALSYRAGHLNGWGEELPLQCRGREVIS
jgi:hypothetical protein